MSFAASGRRIAWRVETERLLLRCWTRADAPRLRAALDECDDHLRPFIPFMKDEPRSLSQTADWLDTHRLAFACGDYFRYAVFDAAEERLLGENMLLTRIGPGVLEIGYWTHKNAVGRGVASEATSAMVRVAFWIHGVGRVEIRCVPENAASAAIPARLGFRHSETLKAHVEDTTGRVRDLMVWKLCSGHTVGRAAANFQFRAYDQDGEPIAVTG
ncbi:MAG: GNAT family N-acetyltransferase [Lysobacterales bacterium]|jgi:RimJ/RimL family protein N-acetyltransferase